MMPAAKRASYFLFFTFHSAALGPRGSPRSQEFLGRDILWHVMGKKSPKIKRKKCQYIDIQYINTF